MNFFLRDVWKQSKLVFAFFVIFILGTAICTFSKIEITPFFLWAHYSEKQIPMFNYERVYVKVNGENLDLPKLSRPTREMIQLPTEYFIQLLRSDYDSNTQQVIRKKFSRYFSDENAVQLENRLCNSERDEYAFLVWLGNYIESITGKSWQSIEVGTYELFFEKDRSAVRREEMPEMSITHP